MWLQHHFWSTMRPPRDQLDGIANGKAVGLGGSSESRRIPEVSGKRKIPRISDDLHYVSQCFPTPILDRSKRNFAGGKPPFARIAKQRSGNTAILQSNQSFSDNFPHGKSSDPRKCVTFIDCFFGTVCAGRKSGFPLGKLTFP